MFSLLKRRGFAWNHKRVYRIYCNLKLNLIKKTKKRLPARDPVTLCQPTRPNESWSLDYMSDALISGKRFRTLNVIDDYNREALIVKAGETMTAHHVTMYLDEISIKRGYPVKIRMDNGPENIARATKEWAKKNNVELEFIQPGKPAQNGYIERFNRSYREEVLDMYLFKNIQEVQQITDLWIDEYNTERPHHSLGNLTPREFANQT